MIIPVNEDTAKIYIGHQMNNDAYSYGIDVSQALEVLGEGGYFTLRPQRPTEANAYSSAYIERDGSTLIWTPHAEDMMINGEGRLQYCYTVGERVFMSKIWTTVICASLSPIADPPSVWESYLQEIEALVQEAKEEVQKIVDMTATASVDDSYGVPSVTVTKTEDDEINLDFAFEHLKGNGITGVSIVGTSQDGLTKTYRLQFNDGYYDYDVKDGNGIASAVLNADYTLTLTFEDGTSYTTPSIRGEQGPKGNVMYATFYVDDNMVLHMVTPDEYTGPTFRLNENKLEVVI